MGFKRDDPMVTTSRHVCKFAHEGRSERDNVKDNRVRNVGVSLPVDLQA